ncbi:hypothetical protein NARC_210032 [Candidatus Nitrosocosmicus arcticus]|uniref:Uncharacterized protein n=1 Tax=Candidatus Nitrosocosmicus arcticus TaxID=2035267 RepID=A0A557SR64_9ARCH|nr:hypothetical protein NARC_210032 [Candidatus Nitrosocosmicus arcticus]
MYRLNINSRKLTSMSFLGFQMRIILVLNCIKIFTRGFQILSSYTKSIVICTIHFLLKKSIKSPMSRIQVVNLRGRTYSNKNLEIGEY